MKPYSSMVGERQVLGVRIDDVSESEALEKISSWLEPRTSNLEPKLIYTPGPEFLVTAQKDPEFKKILNSSDLNVPDGVGLRLAGVRNRVPGVELMIRLCELAVEKDWTVGLIGGFNGVAEKAAKKFPKLKVKFALSDYDADNVIAKSIDRLDKVDILFVGLGHPRQEKFLANSKFKILNSKFRVGMGVGGSFDLIAGTKQRAPLLMRQIGFEWLWRGLQDPRHFFRIWKATVQFTLLLLNYKIYL